MNRSSLIVLAISILALSSACSNLQKKQEATPKPVVSKPAEPEAKPAESLVKKPSLESELVCVHGNDRRTIVISKKNPGCDVHYSKFDQSHHVANAINTPSVCTDVQEKIRTNLEAGQFSCKAGDSARTTASTKK